MKAKLDESKRKKSPIRLSLNHCEQGDIDGIVLHYNRSLVVLQVEDDFELHGVSFIRRSAIREIRDSEYDACCREILEHNGQLAKLSRARWLKSVCAMRDAVEQIRSRHIWPGVEVGGPDEDTIYYLGPVTSIRRSDFSIFCYDAAGNWEKNYEVAFGDVFLVSIWDRYATHFNAFMKTKKRPVDAVREG